MQEVHEMGVFLQVAQLPWQGTQEKGIFYALPSVSTLSCGTYPKEQVMHRLRLMQLAH